MTGQQLSVVSLLNLNHYSHAAKPCPYQAASSAGVLHQQELFADRGAFPVADPF